MGLSMDGIEVTLGQVLDARENRVRRQRELLQQFGCTLICFTLNIPGPVKNNELIGAGFTLGKDLLQAQLAGASIPVLHAEECRGPAGCEGYYLVQAPAETVKELMVQIEDSQSLGRLFDMDVLDPQGRKIQREELGYARRKCLICGNPAAVCGRSRAHSVAQLQQKTRELLLDAVRKREARRIAALAGQSLLYEVCTTPKPGLVDRQNSGSHGDMDIFTFLSSTSALWSYFEDCVQTGMETSHLPPEETFGALRLHGRAAEQAMYAATGGVNTHKGAIFTMGLLCGAAGRLPGTRRSRPEELLAECAAMTKGLSQRDFLEAGAGENPTNGQKLYQQYGITGIRGEAEAGFPTVARVGLPALERGISQGLSVNDAGCGALLAIMAAAADTNLIARSDRQTQLELSAQISRLLARNPYPDKAQLESMDEAFRSRNLSPGGSADLLAASYFLYFMKHGDKQHFLL